MKISHDVSCGKLWSPHPQYQAHIVYGIDSRLVIFTLSDVLCVRCQYSEYFRNWNEWNANTANTRMNEMKWNEWNGENLQTSRQRTDREQRTIREFKNWGHSNPLWIVILARSPRLSTGDKSGLCNWILCLFVCLFSVYLLVCSGQIFSFVIVQYSTV